MKKLEIPTILPLSKKEWINKAAKVSDALTVVKDDAELFYESEKIAVVGTLPQSLKEELRKLIINIPMQRAERSSGLWSTYRTFGFLPRVAKNRSFCTACGLAYDKPGIHQALVATCRVIYQHVEHHFSDIFKKTQAIIEADINHAWRIPEMPFTSGIINKDTPLKYHRDRANYNDQLSLLVCLRKKSMGGHLVIPELNIRCVLTDGQFLLMDGKRFMHGVTPILNEPDGYRYSVVLYAMQQMRHCLPPEEELQRIRRLKREREHRRLIPV